MGLTNHQKRLLRAIAKHQPATIHSQAFLVANRLGSQGGVQTSLAKLKKMDLVEKYGDIWRAVDPVFEKWLIGGYHGIQDRGKAGQEIDHENSDN